MCPPLLRKWSRLMYVLLWLSTALLAGSALLGVCLWRTLRALTPAGMGVMEFARLSAQTGYLPPAPSEAGMRFCYNFCSLVVRWQIGRVTVVNPENLDVQGPCIYTANHGNSTDPMLFRLVTGKHLRYMSAQKVFLAL